MPRIITMSAASCVVTVSPATIANDGVESATIRVRVLDTNGNPVKGLAASYVVLSATGSSNTITQPTGTTDSEGFISGSIVSTASGTKVVSVAVIGTAVTQTVNLTVAASGLGWGFTPTGMTNIVNRAFTTKAASDSDRGTGSFPDKTGGSEGWDGSEWDKANLTIVSDTSAPISPNNVLQIRYPVGLTQNTGPGITQTQSFTAAVHGSRTDSEMYVRGAFKLSSDYFVSGPTNKMFFHRMTQNGGVARGEPFLNLQNNGSGGFTIGANFQGTPDNPLGFFYSTGGTPGAEIAVNTWYRLETYLKLNSAFGVADGVFRCWVNGTLSIERTNVLYLNSATAQYWNTLHISPTYGGSEVNPTEFELFFDQFNVWGKT